MLIKNLDSKYSPLFFLAALGAGGLAVSFFMYPQFMIPHADTPMVTFDHLYPLLTGGDIGTVIALSAALVAVALLSLLHFRLLLWNISEYRRFRNTEAFTALKNSNMEVTLMVIPLTLAMSVNVSFILGAVFVPGLWDYVEYLFPIALLAFSLIGFYALKILGEYFTRLLTNADFDFVSNNNLSQMLAIFALVMIAVGMAAPGAMSHYKEINAIGMFLSLFFLSLAFLLTIIKLVLGFQSILKHGIAEKSAVSLWIMIPILTLGGITIIRLTMGLHHGFEGTLSEPGLFVITSVILSLQIVVGLIGYKVMKKIGYFRDYSQGSKADAGSFSLICPGVAFVVFGMFFIVFGLMKNGLVQPLSPVFFILLLPLALIQLQTVRVYFRLLCRVMAFGSCKITATES